MIVTVVDAMRSFTSARRVEASQKRWIRKTRYEIKVGQPSPRAKRRDLFGGAGVALTYEGVDAVFNVSSYSGALCTSRSS